MVDPRLGPAPEVGDLASALDGTALGLYVGGSLATGDYVPGELVDQVARRRAGETVHLTDEQREARAVVVRRFLQVEVARLTSARERC